MPNCFEVLWPTNGHQWGCNESQGDQQCFFLVVRQGAQSGITNIDAKMSLQKSSSQGQTSNPWQFA